jgi:hypothetical protein
MQTLLSLYTGWQKTSCKIAPAAIQRRQKSKKWGLAATRTRGLSQAVLGFYPKRADSLLDRALEASEEVLLTIIPLDHKTFALKLALKLDGDSEKWLSLILGHCTTSSGRRRENRLETPSLESHGWVGLAQVQPRKRQGAEREKVGQMRPFRSSIGETEHQRYHVASRDDVAGSLYTKGRHGDDDDANT